MLLFNDDSCEISRKNGIRDSSRKAPKLLRELLMKRALRNSSPVVTKLIHDSKKNQIIPKNQMISKESNDSKRIKWFQKNQMIPKESKDSKKIKWIQKNPKDL